MKIPMLSAASLREGWYESKLILPVALAVVLGILCAGLLRGCNAGAEGWNVWVKVIGYDEKTKEVIAQPIISPLMGFKVEEGVTPPKGLLTCVQKGEKREEVVKDVKFVYPVTVLECQEHVKLVLSGIDMRQK